MAKKRSSVCHITGLPYSVSFSSAPSGWSFSGSVSWEGYGWNAGDLEKYLRLRGAENYSDKGKALSPGFKFPADVSSLNIQTTLDCYHYASSGQARYIYVNANTSSCQEITTNGTSITNTKNFSAFNSVSDVVNTITLTTSKPHISITHSVPKEGIRTEFMGIKSLTARYL